jgi:hypothetical protein
MKKKIVIVLLLILFITTSCYAVSVIDTLTCRKVFLQLVKRMILVTYITGEVKYLQSNDGKWVLLKGPLKNQYQNIYNAQINPNRH